MLAFGPLKGLIVLDEVQHAPEIFKVLRVLADERPIRRRFLVLGSASPALLRQSSESLAGRIRAIEMSGLSVAESGADHDRRWLRGGLPRALLARTDADAMEWLTAFIDTITRRDVPSFDSRLPASQIQRLLAMLAHYHGQTLNASAIAASIGIAAPSVRRYVDLLTDLFHVRQLLPWHENLSKRQVKSPKLLIRDSGLFHRLAGIESMAQLLRDPRSRGILGRLRDRGVVDARPIRRSVLVGYSPRRRARSAARPPWSEVRCRGQAIGCTRNDEVDRDGSRGPVARPRRHRGAGQSELRRFRFCASGALRRASSSAGFGVRAAIPPPSCSKALRSRPRIRVRVVDVG